MTRDPKAQPERSTFGVRSLGHDTATRIGVRLVRRWGTGTTSRPPRSGPTTTSPHRSTPTTATATRSARNAGRSATSTGGRHSPVGASVPGASVPRTSRAAREVQAGPGGWESSRESAVSPRVTACAAAPLRKLSPRICRRSTGRESGSGSVLAPGAGVTVETSTAKTAPAAGRRFAVGPLRPPPGYDRAPRRWATRW